MKRLLLDQGCPRSTSATLNAEGWDVVHVGEPNASDRPGGVVKRDHRVQKNSPSGIRIGKTRPSTDSRAVNEWQIREIEAALQEAGAGDFATPSDVERVLGRWRRTVG